MTGLLEGKISVVTGGGAGIGEASVARFVNEGAFVFVVDRSGREIEVASRFGDRAAAFNVDVSSAAAVRKMFKAVDERFGRLDVLFNVAGTAGTDDDIGPIIDSTDDYLGCMVDVNLRSVLLTVKYAIPLMLKAGGGSIINTSSTAGLIASPNAAAYGSSKAGILAFTRAVAREVGAQNIRINSICPGAVETLQLTNFLESKSPRVKVVGATRSQLVAAVALKRLGQADEIAKVALFLASDQSSYITAASIPVDGGYSA